MKRESATERLPVIGWREWVGLPDWGVPAIKVKVDTGARSSSLHAFNIHVEQREGIQLVCFDVHPRQRNSRETLAVEAPLLEFRHVRSSGGHQTLRPVVLVTVELLGRRWPVELTLASRDSMGFRMLLGRQAIRQRFTVDPGRSYLGGKPPKSPRR